MRFGLGEMGFKDRTGFGVFTMLRGRVVPVPLAFKVAGDGDAERAPAGRGPKGLCIVSVVVVDVDVQDI